MDGATSNSTCAKCGTIVPPGADFCLRCGASLVPGAETTQIISTSTTELPTRVLPTPPNPTEAATIESTRDVTFDGRDAMVDEVLTFAGLAAVWLREPARTSPAGEFADVIGRYLGSPASRWV